MAKATAKSTTAAKKVKVKSTSIGIEKASREVLSKLRALDIEPQLQSELEWCLGSYQADRNPVGLYEMINRSIPVFEAEVERKTKGVTAKFVNDLRKSTVDGD